ncbi:histidinol-phosphatase [Actinobacteria bacterium YIM 96077]|uniref:Histidinol-phosphatase n=1 Tax=Phytoactinopolyspora halophila TaxID=1981511 RepID=A0A329R2I6_9ACTN|nr:histidinol-phosphatase [Phytoactinopolyspora halophila]AYY11976.1 histidinol-phosphatase [Actinobacteria bacterium YIM 96077]RAW18790.1 histidinol-phosphatase [Phytoactinopolyspora halophila]
MSHDDDLRFAHVLADDADAQTLSRFRADQLVVDTKADSTPVTEADRAAEEAIRRTLGRARPRDGVLGEEFGTDGYHHRRWVIDPIDGTKNFVRGVPVWATLIALMVDDDVLAGVVSAPALNRRWWAARGAGAWTGRSLSSATRCQVSDAATLDTASLSYSDLAEWERHGLLPTFLDLTRACWRTRAYGDFWSYMLVAEGAVDVAVEPELELYDLAALVPIVEEAGGRFTDLTGGPAPQGSNALATNGRLHDEVLARLSSKPLTGLP